MFGLADLFKAAPNPTLLARLGLFLGIILRLIVAAGFALSLIWFVTRTRVISIDITQRDGLITLSALGLLFAFCAIWPSARTNPKTSAVTRPSARHAPARWPLLLWLGLILISLPMVGLAVTLGITHLDPILVFFRDQGLQEAKDVGLSSFPKDIQQILSYTGLLALSSLVLFYTIRPFGRVLLVLSLVLIIIHPITRFGYRQIVPDPIHAGFDIAAHYQPDPILNPPAEKKNLILIYLESVEASYFDLAQSQEAMAGLADLIGQGQRATQVEQIYGTDYTIAGLVASLCGVPLVPRGLNIAFYGEPDATKQVNRFMPSLRCLGDELASIGYTLSYMNGADLTKFSKQRFLTDHGFTRLFGLGDLEASVTEGRTNIWGYNDALLFDAAKGELRALAQGAAPFALVMLTLSTHGPDGYLDQDCAPYPDAPSQIPRGIECTTALIAGLLDQLDALGLKETTQVVLASDHLARPGTMSQALAGLEQRRNLFALVGQPMPGDWAKPATMLDLYPTLLALLGFDLRDGRAGFGRSLSDTQENLIQRYGSGEALSKIFRNNQAVSELLWK